MNRAGKCEKLDAQTEGLCGYESSFHKSASKKLLGLRVADTQ
jgi:hypothetical protein